VTVPRRLFLVDDQPEMELIVRRLARRAGLELTGRPDVESAWQWLTANQDRPALVLLDVNLPGVSGLELCRRLRAAPQWRDLPVAVFSHWDRGEEIHAALRAGADFVVPKDLVARPDAWRDRIEEAFADLDGRPAAGFLSSPKDGESPPSLDEWTAQLSRAVAQLPLRPLETEVMALLVGRCFHRAAAAKEWAAEMILELDNLAPHLRNSGADIRVLARLLTPRHRQPFVLALGEQVRYTFGTPAVVGFHAALAPAPEAGPSSASPRPLGQTGP
jgi:DNA-binding response OmpR family regulator